MAKHWCCKTCGVVLLLVAEQRDEFCSTRCTRQYYGHGRSNTMPRGDRLVHVEDGVFEPIRLVART